MFLVELLTNIQFSEPALQSWLIHRNGAKCRKIHSCVVKAFCKMLSLFGKYFLGKHYFLSNVVDVAYSIKI